MEERICTYCGKTFERDTKTSSRRKFCCLRCQRNATQNARNARNPQKVSEYNHTGRMKQDILARYDYKCAICGWQAYDGGIAIINGVCHMAHGNEAHHIIHVKDGGKATWDNLIPLCPNHHKMANMGVLPPDELYKYVLPEYTEEEKEAIKRKAIDDSTKRITEAIFGAFENTEEENAD